MKYHDSINKSEKIMTLAVLKLQQWQLPVNPINYSVAYHYCKKNNPALSQSIESQLSTYQSIDGFFMEERYKEFVLGESKFRVEIVGDLDGLLSSMQKSCTTATASSQGLMKKIDQNVPRLISGNKKEIDKAVAQIHQVTDAFKQQQQHLLTQLQTSQAATQLLKDELAETKKEMHLDPVTGLYNHKAMTEYVDTWLAEDADRQIAAIIMEVDHFSQFSVQFGSLIGDVILAKIANKVSAYVNKSGLPVRSSQDEFLILLPDVDSNAASEIANKMKQGIEKLRFVSAKTGIRLPQITVSLGVSEMKKKEKLATFVDRSRKVLTDK